MRRKILFVACCVFLLMLIVYGIAAESGNVAISFDGVKIRYDSIGNGNPALIFVHGWSNNRSIWDAQVSRFSEKYQVIAVDLAGFGESGNNRSDWTIENFANDIIAVADRLGLKQVVLVGFSMGGPVVIEAANKLPDKVAGVVLVDDMQNVEMKIPAQMITQMDSIFMDLVINPSKEKLVKGGFVKNNPDSAFAHVLAMLDNPKIGWEESLISTLHWQNENCTEALSKLKVPVFAINSDHRPTDVEAFRKYVPSFKANIIPNVGHVVMWDAPEEFNRLLEESIQEFMNQ